MNTSSINPLSPGPMGITQNFSRTVKKDAVNTPEDTVILQKAEFAEQSLKLMGDSMKIFDNNPQFDLAPEVGVVNAFQFKASSQDPEVEVITKFNPETKQLIEYQSFTHDNSMKNLARWDENGKLFKIQCTRQHGDVRETLRIENNRTDGTITWTQTVSQGS